MKILGLPGIKPATEHWLKQLLDTIDLNQTEINIQQYQCWSSPGAGLNVDTEATMAASTRPDLVIAKSIGTRVALTTFTSGLHSASAYVFLGVPLRGCSEEDIKNFRKLCDAVPTLFIQQSSDPAGSFSQLVSRLSAASLSRFCEIPGSDHLYGDISQLKQLIESWYRQADRGN